LGIRISNTNSKNRVWVNIYLLGIFWKNYRFFDSSDPFFNIIRKYLENEVDVIKQNYGFDSFIIENKLVGVKNEET